VDTLVALTAELIVAKNAVARIAKSAEEKRQRAGARAARGARKAASTPRATARDGAEPARGSASDSLSEVSADRS
jgi:antitoxin (DNA-binding transcriptional repressor) of toxin-antitoxin stability system